MSATTAALLAALAGILFTGIALAYRWGPERKVSVNNIVFFGGWLAAAAFGVRWGLSGSGFSAKVAVWALLAGFSQYAAIRLLAAALCRGPLSPVWCAVNLSFFLPVLYAAWALNERPSLPQWSALVCAVACVLVSSLTQEPPSTAASSPAAQRPAALRTRLGYAGLILAVLVVNGIMNTVIKYLSAPLPAGGSLMAHYQALFLCVMYIGISGGLGLDLLARRSPFRPLGGALALGLIWSLSSMAGMALVAFCAQAPAAIVFPVVGITALLAGSLLGVGVFRERVTVAWVVMLALGCAAIALSAQGRPQ